MCQRSQFTQRYEIKSQNKIFACREALCHIILLGIKEIGSVVFIFMEKNQQVVGTAVNFVHGTWKQLEIKPGCPF